MLKIKAKKKKKQRKNLQRYDTIRYKGLIINYYRGRGGVRGSSEDLRDHMVFRENGGGSVIAIRL